MSSPAITAKDGLLWRDGKMIPLPEADSVAVANGYQCAEQFVRALVAGQKTPTVKEHGESPRTVVELCRQIADARLARLESSRRKPQPRENIWASSIPVCARQGVYEYVAYDQKKDFDVYLLARFEEGERQEDWVIIELKKLGPQLGFRVVEEQVYLAPAVKEQYRISGKIDGKIEFDGRRRVPFDVKSVHPNLFDKIKTVDDIKHDAFYSKYYRQFQIYMHGHSEVEAIMITTNCVGQWRFIVVPIDPEEIASIKAMAEKINFFVDENKGVTDPNQWKLPERIPYTPEICGKCQFGHVCLPDVLNKSRVRFANDQQLAGAVAKHEELKPMAAQYKSLHEELAEDFKAKREPLIVVGDEPSFIISGKETKGRPSLAPIEEWAADERETFEKLKKKYTNVEPGWSWTVEKQDGVPARQSSPSGRAPEASPVASKPAEPVQLAGEPVETVAQTPLKPAAPLDAKPLGKFPESAVQVTPAKPNIAPITPVKPADSSTQTAVVVNGGRSGAAASDISSAKAGRAKIKIV